MPRGPGQKTLLLAKLVSVDHNEKQQDEAVLKAMGKPREATGECGQFERRVGYWRLRDRDMVSLPRTSIQNSIIKFS